MHKVSQTEAIANFLDKRTHPYLSELYDHYAEVQVLAAQDRGWREDSEYQGRKWVRWTDGFNFWQSFRIPHGSMTDNPHYEEKIMSWDLSEHCDAIGTTGWYFGPECGHSRYLGYDFDAITGHSTNHARKLTGEELQEIEQLVRELDYVTVYSSTSGSGLHLRVFLDPYVPTINHTEHAALARAVLGRMSRDIGLDLSSSVDAYGSVLWLWARKMEKSEGRGLKLLKQGNPLTKVPNGWEANTDVIRRRSTRVAPYMPPDEGENTGASKDMKEMADYINTFPKIQYDDEHKKILDYLENMSDWVSYARDDKDRNMFVTHTLALKQAHTELGLKGLFETASTGSSMQNCYMFPLPKGGFQVIRYGRGGVQEHPSWSRTSDGWTTCYFNREPTIRAAASFFGGVENAKKGFDFPDVSKVLRSLESMGIACEELPEMIKNRRAKISELGDNRVLVEIDCKGIVDAVSMPGWGVKGNNWFRVFYKSQPTSTTGHFSNEHDHIVRYIRNCNGSEVGWAYCASTLDNDWTFPASRENIRSGLRNRGFEQSAIDDVFGACTNAPWTIVNIPFAEEYPGDRRWNRNAAQLAYPVKESNEGLFYPTWKKMLNHVGKGLDRAVKADPWCQNNGIISGGEYLKVWCAYMFQLPEVRLPYLFFYSPQQKTGKTTFYEALSWLFAGHRGYTKAASAITSSFNGELSNAVLCSIEETDLSKDKQAYNVVKDLTTARMISINAKREKVDLVVNTTHWVQCANALSFLPIEPNDTRIVVCLVPEIPQEEMLSAWELESKLRKEASDFLTELFHMELPERPIDRMAIPVIRTFEKARAEVSKESLLQTFLREKCFYIPGATETVARLYEEFQKVLDPEDRPAWTRKRFKRSMPEETYPHGRRSSDSQWCYGNIALDENIAPGKKLVAIGVNDKSKLVED
jgi:hypothetical protein